MQFHYFVNTTELRLKEGFGGEKEAQRQGEDRLALWISVWAHVFTTFWFVFKKLYFGQTLNVWK
jgi:hypothetical protein